MDKGRTHNEHTTHERIDRHKNIAYSFCSEFFDDKIIKLCEHMHAAVNFSAHCQKSISHHFCGHHNTSQVTSISHQ